MHLKAYSVRQDANANKMPARLLYKSKEPSQHFLPKVDDTVCHHRHRTPLFDNFECCSFLIRLFAIRYLFESLADSNVWESIDLKTKVYLTLSRRRVGLSRRYLHKKRKRMLWSLLSSSLLQLVSNATCIISFCEVSIGTTVQVAKYVLVLCELYA